MSVPACFPSCPIYSGPSQLVCIMTRHIPDTARCQNCRYLLRGLPNPVCPECGHPFDPEDPDSYYDPARPSSSIIHKLIERFTPDGPHSTGDISWIALITIVVILMNSSISYIFNLHPGISTLTCCLLFDLPIVNIIVNILLVGIIVDLVWRWRIRARARRTENVQILQNFESGRRRWRLAIACAVVSCVTIVYPWPVYFRFYASWPSLRHEAQDLLAGRGNRVAWRRIGLYDVELFHSLHKGLVFFQVGHNSSVRYGFAYRPNGPPPWNDRYGQHEIHWRWVLPDWYMEAW